MTNSSGSNPLATGLVWRVLSKAIIASIANVLENTKAAVCSTAPAPSLLATATPTAPIANGDSKINKSPHSSLSISDPFSAKFAGSGASVVFS